MKHYLTLLLTLFASLLFGQSRSTQIIGSAGNSVSNSSAQLSWSIGEPIINSGSNGGVELGQGFHQNTLVVNAVEEISALSVSIYPNPTSEVLIVDLNEKNISQASYTITDIQGKLLKSEKIEAAKFQLSFLEYPPAAYLIQISIQDKVRTYKIIKK